MKKSEVIQVRYLEFIVEQYRSIVDPILVNVEKHPFLSIVGLNESGKTTILEAIFAVDHANDGENGGQHLGDIKNAWTLGQPAIPIVSAIVEMSASELKDLLEALPESTVKVLNNQTASATNSTSVRVSRNLETRQYSMGVDTGLSFQAEDQAIRSIFQQLPPIHFYPNEREPLPDSVRIDGGPPDETDAWLPVFNRIFTETRSDYSVYSLPNLVERRRQGVMDHVSNFLNTVLKEHAEAVRFWDAEFIEVELGYQEVPVGSNLQRRLSINVIELDPENRKHYFGVTQRSQGFRWFLAFAIRTLFNPRQALSETTGAVFLFDEPASFLHSAAQRRWVKELRKIGERNSVVYTTHSHHLLDPSIVPIRSTHIAERSKLGSISLRPFHAYKDGRPDQRFALQPVLEALEVQPYTLNIAKGPVIITEGIYDYYALMMFKENRDVTILPGTDAASIKHHVSYMIAWDLDFRALWDHDPEGLAQKHRATESFGEVIANKHFFTLQTDPAQAKRRLEDMFDEEDIREVKKQLELPENTNFERTIQLLFYDPNRDTIVARLPGTSKSSFEELFQQLGL